MSGTAGPVPDPSAPDLRVRHTADLGADERRAIRALLDAAFGTDPPDGFDEHDWDHCLGGLHVTAHRDGTLVGHAALVQRRLVHGGRALRAGYVESVAVAASERRRGVGHLLMAQVEAWLDAAYQVGALGASAVGAHLYRSRGWQPWRGPLSVLGPDGVRPTPDEQGAVLVRPGPVGLDLDAGLTCDWRDGDVW